MEQLKRLRNEKRLSQAKLAARAGLDPSTVNQIERGVREASPPTLRKLADALDVSIADLLESETGKGQGRSSRERPERPFNFREARKELEEYCERWEQTVSEGELNEEIVQEFFLTGLNWLPMADIALRAELDGLRRTTALEGRRELLARSEIAQAYERYSTLFEKVMEAAQGIETTTLDDPETNVIPLEEYRERLANMPDRMFG